MFCWGYLTHAHAKVPGRFFLLRGLGRRLGKGHPLLTAAFAPVILVLPMASIVTLFIYYNNTEYI